MSDTLLSEQLLDALRPYEKVVVVTHDFPDPDAIASGWALQWMVEQRLGKRARLVGGGDIVRTENRSMVRLLEPPLELVSELNIGEDTATVLVDCAPGADNHVLARAKLKPVVNIDHHRSSRKRPSLPFQDLRPDVLALASIATSYLQEQNLAPSWSLATALLYAIRTEAQGGGSEYTPIDNEAVRYATAHADLQVLAKIASAPLTRDYFGDLALALQSTFIYDDLALALLPRVEGQETIGEVADLLLRCEGVQRVLCAALVGERLLLSARTEPGAGDAAELLRTALAGIGRAGGHEHRAGGSIPLSAFEGRSLDELREVVRERWLNACGSERRRGTRLVARREIIENL